MYDNQLQAGSGCVPEAVQQVGAYELDLFKLSYFGWVNSLSLAWGLVCAQIEEESSQEQ